MSNLEKLSKRNLLFNLSTSSGTLRFKLDLLVPIIILSLYLWYIPFWKGKKPKPHKNPNKNQPKF